MGGGVNSKYPQNSKTKYLCSEAEVENLGNRMERKTEIRICKEYKSGIQSGYYIRIEKG